MAYQIVPVVHETDPTKLLSAEVPNIHILSTTPIDEQTYFLILSHDDAGRLRKWLLQGLYPPTCRRVLKEHIFAPGLAFYVFDIPQATVRFMELCERHQISPEAMPEAGGIDLTVG